jgi:hypothetical protein
MTVAAGSSTARRQTLLFVVATGAALALALRAPLLLTVLGLVSFGVLHNALELRYVTGRFAGVLRGPLLYTLAGLISGIVICRLTGERIPEILLGYAVLAVGVGWAPRPLWQRAIGFAVLAGAMAVSLHWPAYHVVVLAHLHNVVPLFFLWEWAGRLPRDARRWFRLTQVGWVLAVPLLIFSGLLDRWIAAGGGAVAAFAGSPAVVRAPFTPPDAAIAVGLRFLVVFAFLQTMHYVVWIAFLPRFAPDASRAFDARVPWLRGRRLWLAAIGVGALLALLFVADYTQGRLMYSSFASYHAYLEFPVVLALLLGTPAARRSEDQWSAPGATTISPSAAPPILSTSAAVRLQDAS